MMLFYRDQVRRQIHDCDESQDSHAARVQASLLGQVTQAGTLGGRGSGKAAKGFGVSV